jgi:hypothetical protein
MLKIGIMIKKILHIRYLQVKRSVQDLTVFHVVALVLIILSISLSFAARLVPNKAQNDNILTLVAIVASMLLFLQLYRPDKRLIFLIAKQPWLIFGGEYGVLLLPIFIVLILLKNPLGVLILGISILCIALINKNLYQNKGVSYFSKLLPPSAFEWRAGMRKSGLIVLLFYILAVAFSGVRVIPFIFLFLGLTLISQFFYSCEPLSILCLTSDNSAAFLRKKIKQSIMIYSLMTLPIIVLAMVFVPDLWFLGPIFYFLAIVNIANFISMKYTFFHPNSTMGAGNLLTSFSLFGTIIPLFAPVQLILLGWYYFQAHKKLKYYLND